MAIPFLPRRDDNQSAATEQATEQATAQAAEAEATGIEVDEVEGSDDSGDSGEQRNPLDETITELGATEPETAESSQASDDDAAALGESIEDGGPGGGFALGVSDAPVDAVTDAIAVDLDEPSEQGPPPADEDSTHRDVDISMTDPAVGEPVPVTTPSPEEPSEQVVPPLGVEVLGNLRSQRERDVLRPGGGQQVARPARVIALANQKGGVGKTTTTINLGAALAELGSRVLLVDIDPQGSLGVGLGADPQSLERTVYNLLLTDGTAVDDVLIETNVENLHLLPANIDLAAAELLLVQEVAREQALRRVIERVQYRYDFILIDCPPSLGLLTINGLTAADSVIVPLEAEYFALRGMSLLMQTLEKVQARLNPRLELQGIVATMFDGRTLHAREVLERVRSAFGDTVFKTTVNKTIRFAEAPVAGEPILTYRPHSKGSDAYRDLAREVLAREPSS